jgi:diadenosine tetraphosphate (Ap4A) HIT family hydrolase
VPHVHFHIIPRPEGVANIPNRSWTMFGKGTRDDLDDEEGERRAKEIREALREEVNRLTKEKSAI